jgi:FtsZ-binding cell division protein ZapB
MKTSFASIDNRPSSIPGVAVADPNDPFERLEQKLSQAIDLFKRTQADNRALVQDAEKLKEEAKTRSQSTGALERELVALRREREEVRARVEKLVERIDELTKSSGE